VRIVPLASTAAVLLAAATVLAGCSTPSTSGSDGAGIDDDALLGTWVLEEAFPSAPETPYLAFLDDKNWVGSDGCNTTAGTFDLESTGEIVVTAGPSTLIACDGAPLPMLFSTATSVSIDGDSLTVVGAEGDITLVRSTDANVGPQDPAGVWGSKDAGQPYLELSADGTVSGNDGCNGIGGSWEYRDGSVEFDDLATTLMACEWIDTWLQGADRAFLQGGVMTVTDDDGAVIGQLIRAG
jgi:heat shock protein HslJ